MWERANGQSDRPLKLIRPSESFEESFEFENEIETAAPLLFMLRRFLEQLAVRLSGIYFVAKELTLRITFSNKQQYERCFKIPQPTNDVDLLFRMLQTHLENFKSEYPITAVSLEAEPTKASQQQFGLFETSLRDPNQLYETLARLIGLLGNDRVGTPVLEETHRPDAFRMEPFAWQLGGTTSVSSHYSSDATERVPPIAMSKPALRRFRPAVSTSVFLSENVPAHIRNANISGKIADQRGPYFVSGNWWDEKIWSRSEWDLQLENDILVRCHKSGENWEIDGVYD
jgi:protein ImuB